MVKNILNKGFYKLRNEGPSEFAHASYRYVSKNILNTYIDHIADKSNLVYDKDIVESTSQSSYFYTNKETVCINGSNSNRQISNRVRKKYFGEYQCNPLFVYDMNGAILNEKGMVFNSDGQLVYNSLGNCEWLYKHRLQEFGSLSSYITAPTESPLFSQIDPPEQTVNKGFDLVRSGSYYHWVTEYLPKIRALEEYERQTGETLPIIVENDPPKWVIEYLKLVNLDENIVQLSDSSAFVENLVSTPHRLRIGNCFNPSTSDLKWVRKKYRRAASADSSLNSSSPSQRIFISREDAQSRKIANRQEFYNRLSDLGFEKHILTDYSIKEQIQLFAHADTVVGVHGAGLTNSLFANQTSIFEIIPSTWIWHDFYCMSEQLGFSYDFYRATQNIEGNEPKRDDNIVIDVDTVINRISRLLNT